MTADRRFQVNDHIPYFGPIARVEKVERHFLWIRYLDPRLDVGVMRVSAILAERCLRGFWRSGPMKWYQVI